MQKMLHLLLLLMFVEQAPNKLYFLYVL